MKITIIGSGSKGNCLVIDSGTTRIAVDAGFGIRTLAKKLAAANIAPESIDACVLTHEHGDHSHCALKARDKWRWTLVATAPTLRAIGTGNMTARVAPLAYRNAATFGDIKLRLLPITHDAAAPAAVFVETASGAAAGIAYDLGEIPAYLAKAFARVDYLVLEANHDTHMLRNGPYSFALQERIAGKRGHLSNAKAAEFVGAIAHKGLRAIVLAHLSQENNTPAIAHAAVARALQGTSFNGTMYPAAQHEASTIGEARTTQLGLF